MYYFSLKNAVFYPTTVGFSGSIVNLCNLMLYITFIISNNACEVAVCMRGYLLAEDTGLLFMIPNKGRKVF